MSLLDTAEASSITRFAEVTNEGTVREARLLVEEHAEARLLVDAGSRLMSAVDTQHQSAEWCAEADGSGDDGGSKERGGTDEIPANLQWQSEVIVASQTTSGEEVPSSLGVVSFWR